MPIIFVLHFKLQKKSIATNFINQNIYQYHINIILLNSNLHLPPKNKGSIFSFPSLISNYVILNSKQTFFLTCNK